MAEQAPGPELLRTFPVPTLEAWRAEAVRSLKGRDPDTLARTLPGGIPCEPLFVARPSGPRPVVARSWRACTWVEADTAEESAAQVAADAAVGAEAVWIERGPLAHGDADLDAALPAPALHGVQVWIDAATEPGDLAAALREVAARRGLAAPDAVVCADARGVAVDELADDLVVPVASGLSWAEAGADPVQELGWTTAALVETFRRLDAEGLAPSSLPAVVLRLSIGDDTFLELAKLRAARLLVARVGEVIGASPTVRLHAVGSRSLLTRHDPWTNLLRASHQAFVGAIAGADLVTVSPWDRALGRPSAHARRLAATTHAVLRHEGHLDAVADPAAGAWYVESLTERLAAAAWDLLRQVEREGGLLAYEASGALRAGLDRSRAAVERAVATRARPLVGTSVFPNPAEQVEPRPPAPEPAPFRPSEAWERVRDAASVRVFLANLGAPARHRARAEFARQLFEAGGFDVVEGGGDTDVGAIAAAFRASGAAGAVLCGHDEDYGTLVVPLAAALRGAGAAFVVLAGRPGPNEADWRAAGLTHAVFLGADVRAVLAELKGVP